MGLDDDYSLALADIKKYISPKSLSYLTSMLIRQRSSQECDSNISGQRTGNGQCSDWSDSTRANSVIRTPSGDLGSDMKSDNGSGGGPGSSRGGQHRGSEQMLAYGTGIIGADKKVSVTLPFVNLKLNEETAKVSPGERRICLLSSIQQHPLGIISTRKSQALCSQLYPICRKIIAKTPPFYRINTRNGDLDVKSVSEETEREIKSGVAEADRDSPYRELVGKISQTRLQKDFARVPLSVLVSPEKDNVRKQEKKKVAPISDFSKPVTNPLYKEYNPKGYQKTDDEIAIEHIGKIGREFNDWLETLEGDATHLDLQLMTRILRQELQLPD